MDYAEFLGVLRESATEKHKAFLEKIVNTSTRILGVKSAAMGAVSKRLKNKVEAVCAFPSNEYYEVDMVKGSVIAGADIGFNEKTAYLDAFAPTIDNWAVCDCVGGSIKIKPEEREKLWEYALKLVGSDKTFVVRLGIIIAMNFVTADKLGALFGMLDNICYGEYYIDMASAWLLSVMFVEFKDETVKYITGSDKLTKSVKKKALQKVRDSYRVSPQDKELTKKMLI